MTTTLAEQITAILADWTTVLTAVLNAIGDVFAFMISNPLIVIAVMLTIVGVAVKFGRRLIRQ